MDWIARSIDSRLNVSLVNGYWNIRRKADNLTSTRYQITRLLYTHSPEGDLGNLENGKLGDLGDLYNRYATFETNF